MRYALALALVISTAACGGPRPVPLWGPPATLYTPPLAAPTTAAAPAAIPTPAPPVQRVINLVKASPAMTITDRSMSIERQESLGQHVSIRSTLFVKYVHAGSGAAAHDATKFRFTFTELDVRSSGMITSKPLALGLSIQNGSATALLIDWATVNLVVGGRAMPVIHRGVKMVDRGAPTAPSTIPPSASLDDFVYPRELLGFSAGYGRYGSSSWYGANFFEGLRPGTSFTLYLPVKRGGETTEYQFAFEVQDDAAAASGPSFSPPAPIDPSATSPPRPAPDWCKAENVVWQGDRCVEKK